MTEKQNILRIFKTKTMIDNIVIKNLSKESYPQIKKYFEDRGFDTSLYSGNSTVDNYSHFIYYGVINGTFGNYSTQVVNEANVKIITLPEENIYPKWMYVSNDENGPIMRWYKRKVITEKCGKYIAWWRAETEEEVENETCTLVWNLAKDVEEVEEKTEVTLEEVAKAMNIPLDKLRIKK